MSFIKDHPCPHCGANLYKVGFRFIWNDVQLTIFHYYLQSQHHSGQNYEMNKPGYVECGKCNTKINIDVSVLTYMMSEEWA